jgi:uncharacterized protein (TIGR04255 family)
MTADLLPEFTDPPVTEVALAVRFEGVEALRSAHVGRFWQLLVGFTQTEDHVELDLGIEQAGGPEPPQRPRLELVDVPRVRTWLKTADETRLIQLQHNCFVYNWRRAASSDPYPHYESVRKEFLGAFEKFADFVAAEQVGKVSPVQCEVTYVNHLHLKHSAVADALTLWCKSSATGFLPQVEDARFMVRYAIPEPNGSGGLLGRLTASLQPAYLVTSKDQVLNLTLIARGRPFSTEQSSNPVLNFLDLGHEWIVRGFAEITSEAMHHAWGRTR